MNSLNNIIDDIMLQARNSNIGESEKLSRHQVEMWIHNYRAYLIKQELDKKSITELDPAYVQTLSDIHLDEQSNKYGQTVYVGDKELPSLINFNNRPGIVCIKDKVGNIIQLGSETKMKFQSSRKYTCNDYIAYVKGNKIYVEAAESALEYIDVDLVMEDPTAMQECFDPDGPYPVPDRMIPTIKDLIFSKELRIMPQMPSDETNNSDDDNQNRVWKR